MVAPRGIAQPNGSDHNGTAKLPHWLIAAFVIAPPTLSSAMTRVSDP